VTLHHHSSSHHNDPNKNQLIENNLSSPSTPQIEVLKRKSNGHFANEGPIPTC
jgi:hypothetical protein